MQKKEKTPRMSNGYSKSKDSSSQWKNRSRGGLEKDAERRCGGFQRQHFGAKQGYGMLFPKSKGAKNSIEIQIGGDITMPGESKKERDE